VARFEAERQALALMDHPNIAKVLDAGATETGRPYFVMELVRGVRITDYCDQHQLATQERLELFLMVCHAIQHAHQKEIIHRDIKPSNILVTLHDGVPVPKVIDFGIANATQQELTELTLYTQHQQFVGTPVYMSPEQAEMSGLEPFPPQPRTHGGGDGDRHQQPAQLRADAMSPAPARRAGVCHAES
jgi:serine/threonine protein kinase